MKKIILILFYLTLQFGSWANDDTTRVVQHYEIIGKSELTSNDQILESRVNLLEKHEIWTLAMLGIGLTITALILGLIQWLLSVRAKDAVYNELALIANQDKDAFKKSLKVKAVEMELTTKYPIYIVTDQYKKNDNSAKIQNLLRGYDFEQIKKISYKQALEMSFCNKSVVILCDEPIDENKNIELVKKHNGCLAVMGFGGRYSDKFKDLFKNNGCINFAQFYAQIYNNLMSLLHYKRYLNSTIAKDSLQC